MQWTRPIQSLNNLGVLLCDIYYVLHYINTILDRQGYTWDYALFSSEQFAVMEMSGWLEDSSSSREG